MTFLENMGKILGLDRIRTAINAQFIGYYAYVAFDCLDYIEEGFKLNSDVFTCIDWIANKVNEPDFTLYKKIQGKDKEFAQFKKYRQSKDMKKQKAASKMVGKDVEEITSAPILTMLNKKPNPNMIGSLWRKGIVINLLLTGNSLIYGVDPDSAPGKFLELYPMPTQATQPVANGQLGDVTGYRFTYVPNKIIPKANMCHIKYFNPDFTSENPYVMGLSPLAAAAGAIRVGNKGQDATAQAYDNGGAGGILFSKGGEVTEEDRQRLQKTINTKLAGTANYKSIAAASGEMGFVKLQDSVVDLNVMEMGLDSRRKICNVFHLDSKILNDPESSTYNNVVEAQKGSTINGVFPVITMIEDCLTDWLIPGWYNDDSYYLALDRSVFPELQGNMKEKVEYLDKAWWLSPNQKLTEMDYENDPDPLMDKKYIPNNVVPLDEVGLDMSQFQTQDNPQNPDYEGNN